MNETGWIVETKGGQAVVRIARNSACAQCGACQLGCHQDEMLLTIPNRLNGEPGDAVELELSSNQVLKASAITYLIPLAALIFGVFLGYRLAPQWGMDPDLLGGGLGLFLTIGSFFGIRGMERLLKQGNQFSPQMVKIYKGYRKGEMDNGK